MSFSEGYYFVIIDELNRAGVDYVSASPYRVPVARLAAAQAAVKEKLGIRGPVSE